MQHQLPKLPYAMDALAPYMSRETLEYHYGKHHQAYIDKLNDLVRETEFEDMSLEQTIRNSSGAIYNNAAQAWNHNFLWKCLAPNSAGQPDGELASGIEKRFGSFEQFKEQFKKEAVNHFGSGWAWLVLGRDGTLAIENTHDADNPLLGNRTPLLTCDVWEHAYYIDYRNDRADFINAFWNIVNWDFVAQNYAESHDGQQDIRRQTIEASWAPGPNDQAYRF